MKPHFSLQSPETGTDYQIYVVAPTEPGVDGPWPAILFMDGDDQFETAIAIYRSERTAGRLPPLLLVGVGYGASYAKPQNRRVRDYTPTPHADEQGAGGATAFMAFLRGTLWPALAHRYPLLTDVKGIAGHSLGSLFALYALFQDRPFFTHYLASSPSVWWDNRSIIQLAADRHARNSTLPAHVYLSVGAEDSASMTADLSLLDRQLRTQSFAGLKITTQRFPARDHFNVLPDAFRAGFVTLFGETSPSVR